MKRLICLSAAAVLLVIGCGYHIPYSQGPVATLQTPTSCLSYSHPSTVWPNGLHIIDLKQGAGVTANSGEQLSVTYTGKLSNGKVFDASSRHGNEPFTFVLGQGQVIPGWDMGLACMHVGGERELVIPPALAYGAKGAPPAIPGNATLTFTITLIKVAPAPSPTPAAATP